MYFMLNHRPNGDNHYLGAGVATVSVSNTMPPVPTAKRLSQYWWNGETEPWFGNIGAIQTGGYIYTYGQGNSTASVYLARVPSQSATDLSSYEYWNGDDWQKDCPQHPGDQESVLKDVNQGQVVWSNYYQCFLFIYCGKHID